MDPELLAILARHGLTADASANLSALSAMSDDALTALQLDLLHEAHRRRDALEAGEVDPPAVLTVLDASTAVLDVLEARPSVVAAAADRTIRAAADLTGGATRTRVAARRPAFMRPRGVASAGSIVAAGGGTLTSDQLVQRVAEALYEAHRGRTSLGFRPDGSVLVASLRPRADLPRLGADALENESAIVAAVEAQREALTAAGGLCAPLEPIYELEVAASDDRPVRDSLVRFLADRGGVRFMAPPTLADVAPGIGVWTHANDVAPGTDGPATKPRVTLACGDVEEVYVRAVTSRVRVGNWAMRFQTELVAAWLRLLAAEQARTAEDELLDALTAGSTAVTSAALLGATRDLLTTIDRAAAAYRSRQRLSAAAPLVAILPAWARDLMRADLARELPGSTAERLATANAEMDRFFAARNVRPTWSLDAQPFGAQAAGALNNWPGTVTFWLFTSGTWLFLDGGSLDVGVTRDSTLNETNDAEVFAETFEAAAMVGTESLVVTATVCPDGSTAGTVDTTTLCP